MDKEPVLTKQIEIQEMPNRDYVTVHFNFELDCVSGTYLDRQTLRKNCLIGGETRSIIDAIMSVDGVAGITIYPYRISLEKGRLFEFDDIAMRIAQSLMPLLGPLESSFKKYLDDFGTNAYFGIH